jgi:hypothetical protein
MHKDENRISVMKNALKRFKARGVSRIAVEADFEDPPEELPDAVDELEQLTTGRRVRKRRTP